MDNNYDAVDFMFISVSGLIILILVFSAIVRYERYRIQRDWTISHTLGSDIIGSLRGILPNSRYIQVLEKSPDLVVFKWQNHVYIVDINGAIYEIKKNWFRKTKLVITKNSKDLQSRILAYNKNNVILVENGLITHVR